MSSPHDNDDIELRPLGESRFAVEHGLSRSAPDVIVAGPAVRRGREAAALSPADVAAAMTGRGFTTDATTVAALEDSPAYRMRPREARLLAAILGLPLPAIEARAEPWPADEPDGLTSLRAAGAEPVVLGHDVVVKTGTGSYLGLLRCAGDVTVLDSRTYRAAAASLLNGAWSHLAGALLVAERPPHQALAVDALDCVTRSHAPTGLSGYSRLAEPEPLAEALASYDRAYAIGWSDPEPLAAPGGTIGSRRGLREGGLGAARTAALAERLGDEGRRARQPGKRPGYTAAAKWLRQADAEQLAELLDELAAASPEQAGERLREVLFR